MIHDDIQSCTASNDSNAAIDVEMAILEQDSWSQKQVRRLIRLE
jgi:hypothetical protein